MPELRACPACGGEEHRRSRRRGLWEHLLGWMGILPYVCKTCRKRFLASKNVLAARIIILFVFLILAVACTWWLYKKSNPPQYQTAMSNTQVKVQAQALEGQLREQIGALANSLVEVRREKAALMAELTLLRDQLRGHVRAAKTTGAQPSPNAAPTAARSFLGWVGFSPGSVEVNAKGIRTLASIATQSIQTPGARLLVEGTTDSSPLGAQAAARFEDNLGLSLARALSVFRALRELGVERERMGLAASGQADSGKNDERTVGIWLIAAN